MATNTTFMISLLEVDIFNVLLQVGSTSFQGLEGTMFTFDIFYLSLLNGLVELFCAAPCWIL